MIIICFPWRWYSNNAYTFEFTRVQWILPTFIKYTIIITEFSQSNWLTSPPHIYFWGYSSAMNSINISYYYHFYWVSPIPTTSFTTAYTFEPTWGQWILSKFTTVIITEFPPLHHRLTSPPTVLVSLLECNELYQNVLLLLLLSFLDPI